MLLGKILLLLRGRYGRLIHYLQTGNLLPNPSRADQPWDPAQPLPIQSWVRLMLAAPGTIDLPEVETLAIKLFSLPQRKADIPDFARYFLSRFCQEQNRPSSP
jgi:hypothetical protein